MQDYVDNSSVERHMITDFFGFSKWKPCDNWKEQLTNLKGDIFEDFGINAREIDDSCIHGDKN